MVSKGLYLTKHANVVEVVCWLGGGSESTTSAVAAGGGLEATTSAAATCSEIQIKRVTHVHIFDV